MTAAGASYRLIPDILTNIASLDGDNGTALHFHDQTWSFQELSNRAASIAALSTEATSPNQSVAVLGANHPDWVAAYYGVSAGGRVLCFLNHRLSPLELIEQMHRANVGLLLVSSEQEQRLRPFLSQLNEPVTLTLFGEPLPSANLHSVTATHLEEDEPAWLLFTSGTTGKPKGVLLSHRNVFAALRSSQHARSVGEHDVFAYPFPTCHIAGYNILRLHCHGRPVVLMEGFDPVEFIDNIERHSVNSASVAATMLSGLLMHLDDQPSDVARLKALTTLGYGAAPMPATLLTRAHDLLGLSFSQGFGMTELAGNALFLDVAAHERGFRHDPSLLRATGSPGPGVQVKITDEEGVEVDPGVPGEISIRAEQVMLGYLDDPEETKRVLVDGWLRTGDVGVLRLDGIIEVVDRLKDVIVTGGENVASLEVEHTIREHCDEVADIAVVGVPDPKWGENVCACIVLRPETTLDLDEITRRLSDSLAPFKIPRHLVVFDVLPQTHSGKVGKATLRACLAENPERLGPRRGSSR